LAAYCHGVVGDLAVQLDGLVVDVVVVAVEEGKSVFVGAVLSTPVTRDSLKPGTCVQLSAISLSMEDSEERVGL
jgi:hypothetical protein